MKKYVLFLAICCMASGLLAQSPSPLDLHRKLMENHGKLSPELIRKEVSKFNDRTEQAPTVFLDPAYNLTDSLYEYYWDGFFNEWMPVFKTLYENDCTLGKPTTILKQVDDFQSGNFENYSKILKEYFEDSAEKKSETFNWHPIQQTWEQNSYLSYVRPNDLEEDWNKIWDSNTSSFNGGSRAVYSYNNDNDLSRLDAYNWEVDAWVQSYRTNYTYVGGLNTERFGESYDAATDNWVPYERVTSTYDANGSLLTQKTENYLGAGFTDFQLVTYTYLPATNKILEILYQYNNGNGFENSSKTVYNYHADGYVENFELYSWWATNQEWINTSKFNFREDGNITSLWYKVFFGEFMGQFDFGGQIQYTYTPEGLLESYVFDEYNPQGSPEWLPYQKTTYTYDGNDRRLEEILQTWDETAAAYENSYRSYNFNTGCLFSDVEEGQPSESCLHANPLRAGQAIRCDALPNTDAPMTLSLYSLSGTQAHRQAFRPGDALQPRNLAPGIYIMDIRTADRHSVYRSKLVVME